MAIRRLLLKLQVVTIFTVIPSSVGAFLVQPCTRSSWQFPSHGRLTLPSVCPQPAAVDLVGRGAFRETSFGYSWYGHVKQRESAFYRSSRREKTRGSDRSKRVELPGKSSVMSFWIPKIELEFPGGWKGVGSSDARRDGAHSHPETEELAKGPTFPESETSKVKHSGLNQIGVGNTSQSPGQAVNDTIKISWDGNVTIHQNTTTADVSESKASFVQCNASTWGFHFTCVVQHAHLQYSLKSSSC